MPAIVPANHSTCSAPERIDEPRNEGQVKCPGATASKSADTSLRIILNAERQLLGNRRDQYSSNDPKENPSPTLIADKLVKLRRIDVFAAAGLSSRSSGMIQMRKQEILMQPLTTKGSSEAEVSSCKTRERSPQQQRGADRVYRNDMRKRACASQSR